MINLARLVKTHLQHIRAINLTYLRKWLLIGFMIGVVAGVGSIALVIAINWLTSLFLGQGAGFIPPAPVGEGQTIVTAITRRWMIPLMTTIGGLLSGFIVYKLAPEAAGAGTDLAIEAFHENEGKIRSRVPIIKLITSAITIGSGGSAGREGPAAQITAGFGSLLGRIFHLTVEERRIAVAAGIGAGIGAVFRAPLGGAILSTEVLYLEGFEISALIPSFIASVVGYTIFSSWAGFGPIFGNHFNVVFDDPVSLVYYVVLGVVCGGVGILYPKCFYGVRKLFNWLRLPNYLKPAIGSLAVGIMGIFLPQVLGQGYGWLQIVMEPQVIIPVGVLVLLAFAKIVATSLSLGSGGSGGEFAPGLFIGGMLAAAMWSLMQGHLPHVPASPEAFVVVGMMALFGSVARAPLAVMFMVGEMTGSYTMLAPAMIAVGIAYVIVGKDTIYESQVASPAVSPAHRYEYSFPLLGRLNVKDAMRKEVTPLTVRDTLETAEQTFTADHLKSLPVVDSHNHGLVGIISREDLMRVPQRNGQKVSKFMTHDVITITPEDSLDRALELLSRYDISSLPVLEKPEKGSKLLGMISRRDITRTYTRTAKNLLDKHLQTRQQESKEK